MSKFKITIPHAVGNTVLEVESTGTPRVEAVRGGCAAASEPAAAFWINLYGDDDHPGYGIYRTFGAAEEKGEDDSTYVSTVAVHALARAPTSYARSWPMGKKRSGREVISNGSLEHPIRTTTRTLYELEDGSYGVWPT